MKAKPDCLQPLAILRQITARLPQIHHPAAPPRGQCQPCLTGFQQAAAAHYPEQMQPRLVCPCMMLRLIPPHPANGKHMPEQPPRLRRGFGNVKTGKRDGHDVSEGRQIS